MYDWVCQSHVCGHGYRPLWDTCLHVWPTGPGVEPKCLCAQGAAELWGVRWGHLPVLICNVTLRANLGDSGLRARLCATALPAVSHFFLAITLEAGAGVNPILLVGKLRLREVT